MSDSEFELHLLDSSSSDETDTTLIVTSSDEEESICESEEASVSTNKTEETLLLFDSFYDEDVFDIIQDIYNQFDEYYENNIINISSPKFYSDMFKCISEILWNEWENIELCDEEDFNQIVNFVESQHEEYMLYNNHIIPRSLTNTSNIMNELNVEEINKLNETIEYIKIQPQPAQRTTEWYEFRNSLLSASSLWKALGTQSQINSLIYEKCKAYNNEFERISYGTSTPMHWGVKYEPVTIMIYEDLYQTTVGEFGCIRHSEYPFIGASPDGININPSSLKYGHMVEIKNIVNREITGIPKEEYWIQTQIQMETCKLDNCDFVETRIKEYDNKEDFYNNTTNSEYRGIVLHFINSDFKENDEPIYHYMPLNIPLINNDIDDWTNKEVQLMRDKNHVLFNTIYWYLDEISCVLIQRNQYWFSNAIQKIRDVWDIIEKEKITGYEQRSPKKRTHKPNVTIDDVSGSHTIHNMPLNNHDCLIKLDSK